MQPREIQCFPCSVEVGNNGYNVVTKSEEKYTFQANPTTTTKVVHRKKGRSIMNYCGMFIDNVIPRGGVLSNSFNLASASVGAGIFTLPWAFRACGVVMGTIYLIIMTIFTVYTITIMGYVMEKTGFQAFEQMSRGVLGKGSDYLMAVIMGVSCFGAAVAYLITAESLLTPVLVLSSSTPDFFKTRWGIRTITCGVWLLGMLPLVIPKEVNTLRYFSACGMIFVLYFCILIVVYSCQSGLPKRSEVELVVGGNIAIEGFSVFVFAYLCQAVAYKVYFEMKVCNTSQLALSATLGMTMCSVLYWLCGFFGYMGFGKGVAESVFLMYNPIREPLLMVAYIGLVVKLCTSYALNMIPCRNTVYYIIGWDIDSLPYWKHITTVTIISIIILLCGFFIPRISTAFDLAGGVCGGFIGFIYPALFYMYSGNWTLANVGWFHFIMTYLCLLTGVVSVVFGTGATIHSLFF